MSLQPYNSWELVGGMEREGDKMGWGGCVIPAVPSHLGDLRAPGTTCPQGPLLTQGEPGPNRRGAAGGGGVQGAVPIAGYGCRGREGHTQWGAPGGHTQTRGGGPGARGRGRGPRTQPRGVQEEQERGGERG